jgi:hypothetical protein
MLGREIHDRITEIGKDKAGSGRGLFQVTAPKFAGRYPGKPRKFSFMLQTFPNIYNSYVPEVYKVRNEYTYGQWNVIGSSMTVPSPLLSPNSILPPP